MANKTVDFQKLRKKRQRAETFRRFLILAAVTAGLAGIVYLNSLMVEHGVTTRIGDLVGGVGGTGYPAPVPGGIIRDVKDSGNYLAVLNDTNLSLYNSKGKLSGSFQAMSDNTVLLAGGDRLLTFDVGAKKFSVHSRTKTLLTKELEYGVFAGCMNDRGDFAIVGSSRQAACEITVYNKRMSEIYICYLAENIAATVSLSPSGGMLAAGWINGGGGIIRSGVNLYLIGNQEGPAAVLELPDEMILDVRFYEEDRVGVLTDRQYMVIGVDGAVKGSYDFAGRSISAFESDGRQTLLLCEEREARTSEVILLGAQCEEKAVLQMTDRVTGMALSAKRIYLLTEDGIYSYDAKLEPLEYEPAQFASHIQIVKGRLYYLTREEIRVLGQTSQNEESAGSEGEADLPAGRGQNAESGDGL